MSKTTSCNPTKSSGLFWYFGVSKTDKHCKINKKWHYSFKLTAPLDANFNRYFLMYFLWLLSFSSSELIVALHRFTSIFYIYVIMNENIYSQLKWFCQRKKAEMNKGKSQRGTVYRNLNSKCSCWILRMCEK